MKKLLFYITILSFLTITVSCMTNRNTKFSWEATWNAPKGYPVELITGGFICEEGGENLRGGSSASGWGLTGPVSVGNTAPKMLPKALYVHWYSFVEDKFYEGVIDLPYEQILKHFREGFYMFRAKKKTTYYDIIAGFAPGGRVAIWLNGNGKELEIGHYYVEESEYMSVHDFLDGYYYTSKGREGIQMYRADILKHYKLNVDSIDRHSIPFDLWDTYRERFNLRPVMVYEDSTCVTDEIYMKYINGERESLSLDELATNPFRKRARINYLNAYWSFGDTIREVIIKFNEAEIFDIYEEVYQGDPNAQVELQLHLVDENDHFSVYFVNAKSNNPTRRRATRAHIKIYRVEEFDRDDFEVLRNK